MSKNYKRNLRIGFGVSLLILLISSVASFISIRNLLDSTAQVRHTNEVILEMEAVKAAIVDAETGQRGFLITGDDSFLDPFNDSKQRVITAYNNALSLTEDNLAQQRDLPALYKLIEDRFEYFNVTITDKKLGKETSIATLNNGKIVMDQIRDQIRMMEERERQLLEQRVGSMNKFATFTPILIGVGAVIALIITLAFYTRVSNDFEEKARLQEELQEKDRVITQRIDVIKGIADKISGGNYSVRVSDDQSDSLGNVAGALNKMAGSLQASFDQLSDKEWLQRGISELNDLLIGDKPVNKLAQDILEYISGFANSQAGAFYVLEHDNLVIHASYAYMPGASAKSVKLGEGFIGQAVTSGKVLEVSDIPEESIFISFTSAHAKPKHIVALPLYDGYAIKGGIELASLTGFSEREIEFFKTATRNIAIAISTAQNKKRMQELLEETQSQSEELQAQHSELENMNSELEVQAEKLQASEEELKVQQEELKQANQELEERSRLLEERNQVITERNFDIQSKAKELEQSTKYKSEFLANMSHELRTPLNSILLLSRLLGENTEKNLGSDQVEYARVIQSSGQGLLSLIDEILDLSKIESGKMELEYAPVSLREISKDMQGLFNPVAQDKGIELKINIAKNVPERIETDKLRLEQVVRNLLSNALKFTANGYVSLSISNSDRYADHLSISVKDTGIGIPEEKQKLVFEAFQQADGSTRRKYGGTGLGLSISRELVKLLGGELELKSEVGEGSEFTLYLPIQKGKARPAVAETETSDEPVAEYKKRIPGKFISSEIPESIPDDREAIKQGDRVMLIVEDDVNFAKSLLDFTRKRGYKGVVAVRGDEGLELAHHFLPIGVLLDIQLPVISGWEVMDELKNNPKTRHIPVHIMSSYEVKSESLVKGAVDFINKPMAFEQMQTIFEKIEQVLTRNPKKVLIVEENTKHARALAYFLETYNINLEVKHGVDEAVGSLKQDSIDCVILDMGIPDQKSYDTLEEVKKIPGLENLPIIIFTGKSLSKTEEQRIKKYADSIVIKTAHSYKRILDEVSLFLHLVENNNEKEESKSKYQKLGALDEVLKNKTVLVADDDMRNIFSLTKALENYKMNVITAVDGKDALRQLRGNTKVDIVLMDMMMPEMDGYESTREIRKDRNLRDIPVIAVTAKAMMGDRARCIDAGASDYITKPVDIDQLLSLLRVWLYESGIRK
jgi:signal transduction histidine kinase/DNA-binding response OmpR family regulator/CHASE3 domain sensor protein